MALRSISTKLFRHQHSEVIDIAAILAGSGQFDPVDDVAEQFRALLASLAAHPAGFKILPALILRKPLKTEFHPILPCRGQSNGEAHLVHPAAGLSWHEGSSSACPDLPSRNLWWAGGKELPPIQSPNICQQTINSSQQAQGKPAGLHRALV